MSSGDAQAVQATQLELLHFVNCDLEPYRSKTQVLVRRSGDILTVIGGSEIDGPSGYKVSKKFERHYNGSLPLGHREKYVGEWETQKNKYGIIDYPNNGVFP